MIIHFQSSIGDPRPLIIDHRSSIGGPRPLINGHRSVSSLLLPRRPLACLGASFPPLFRCASGLPEQAPVSRPDLPPPLQKSLCSAVSFFFPTLLSVRSVFCRFQFQSLSSPFLPSPPSRMSPASPVSAPSGCRSQSVARGAPPLCDLFPLSRPVHAWGLEPTRFLSLLRPRLRPKAALPRRPREPHPPLSLPLLACSSCPLLSLARVPASSASDAYSFRYVSLSSRFPLPSPLQLLQARQLQLHQHHTPFPFPACSISAQPSIT